ncbi:MAG: hypothetical protein PUC73_01630 [Lachnospiraceae bacterium]|nr:hypothetical protein [Lachnospiraceae bacterium]
MYKTIPAIIINCIFGICLAYDLLLAELAGKLGGRTNDKTLIGLLIFNVVWIVLFLTYNIVRFKKNGGGNTYWIILLASFLPWSILIKILFLF